MAKKGDIAAAASKIIKPKGAGERPSSLSDLLGGKEETVETETRINGDTDERIYGYTDERKTVRQEFLFPPDLAEELRLYAFEHRTSKAAFVIEAVQKHLKLKKKNG